MQRCKSIFKMVYSNITFKILSIQVKNHKEATKLILLAEGQECGALLMLRESMAAWIRVKVNKQDHCLERGRPAKILTIQMIKRLIGQHEVVLEPMEVFWIQVSALWRELMNSQAKQ